MTATGIKPTTTSLVNKHSTIWPNWPNNWAVLWVLICTVHLIVCSCHVTYTFQSESTPYICLNVRKILAQNKRDIWSLSVYNGTRTNNHLFGKWTLNHLGKLAKWLSHFASSYVCGTFNSMFLSSHVRTSEWNHTLYLPECQRTPCSKQVRCLKFKWLQGDSNP